MSADITSSEGPRPGTAQPEQAPQALRVLAFAAVAVGLAALAAGTFILSYSGIHALALQAGVAPRLARGYPLLIDAMLVIVLAAVLALRGADLPSRVLAWVTLLAVLAAAAGANALHAAGRKVPDHVAAIAAAVLPWVLVFLAFALLLAMLRHARLRRLAATRERQGSDEGPPDLANQAGQPDQAGQADEAGQPHQALEDGGQDDPDMPVFHRMWSSPTPPEPLS